MVNEDNFASQSINVASTVEPSPPYPRLNNEVWKKKGRSHEKRSLSQLSQQQVPTCMPPIKQGGSLASILQSASSHQVPKKELNESVVLLSKQEALSFLKNGSLNKQLSSQNRKQIDNFVKIRDRNNFENMMNGVP